MILTKDKGQRMWGWGGSSSGGGGGLNANQLEGMLSGYASQDWVTQNFLSIDFFNRVFTIHGEGSAIVEPNDTESTIKSIEAMFGFWTNFYITALGNGGEIGNAIYLSQLADVQLSSPSNGQCLIYNGTTHKWENGVVTNGTVRSVGLSAPTGFTVTGSPVTGTGTLALAFETGYSLPKTADVNKGMTAYGWGDHSQAGYATRTWVGQNYVSIAFFSRLFQARNGSTAINPNDMTTTITNIKAMFGFWTDFYISALGNGGSAGSAIYLSQLADVELSNPSDGQVLMYSSGKWVNGSGGGGTGSVRSVAMTVPTGFTVSGSPITNSGTLALTFANGYSLPTTAKQSNWDTAYNNNHTHSNKSTIDNISSSNITSWNDAASTASTLAGYFSNGNANAALKLTTVSKTAWGQTYWTSGGVPTSISGNMSDVGNISFSGSGKNIGGIIYFDTNYNHIGINKSSPGYSLDVTGNSAFSGTVTVGNLSSTGYVTALSDIREKNIVDYVKLTLQEIAAAPMIRFKWKDREDEDLHVGSIAQYWTNVLPEAVPTDDQNRLMMDYGVIALLSAVTISQKVLNHEDRIMELEKKLKSL